MLWPVVAAAASTTSMHGIHRHDLRCGEREAPALGVIGAGLEETAEGLRSQARHQTGDALAGSRLPDPARPEISSAIWPR